MKQRVNRSSANKEHGKSSQGATLRCGNATHMTSTAAAEFTAPDPEITRSRVKIEFESHPRGADGDVDDIFEVVLDVLRGDFGGWAAS